MKQIISCSRRTDVPAFYYQWLQKNLKQRQVSVINQYNGQTSVVDLSPDVVHSIVLWSKNYINVLDDPQYLKDFNLYFQFTINDYNQLLEPFVVDKKESLRQMKALAYKYSPEQINWRFDPLVISEKGEFCPSDPLAQARLNCFATLCKLVSECGVTRCTTSFLSPYGSVKARLSKNNFPYFLPTPQEQHIILTKMVQIASNYDIQIYTCSNPSLENVNGVKRSSCIDGDLLSNLFGEKATKSKDTGQRKECGCHKSKDIAHYGLKCLHNCLYCYANPGV